MPYEYDTTGADMSGQGDFVIPDGEYIMRIEKVTEGRSKKENEYQVTCDLKVVEGDRKNFQVRFHRVTFTDPKRSPKGAGMAIHFLKTIGQPWENKPNIDPSHWVGKVFMAWLEVSEYNNFKSMKIKWVKPVDKAIAEELEEVPF